MSCEREFETRAPARQADRGRVVAHAIVAGKTRDPARQAGRGEKKIAGREKPDGRDLLIPAAAAIGQSFDALAVDVRLRVIQCWIVQRDRFSFIERRHALDRI